MLSMGTLIVAAIGAAVAWRKLKPETTQIVVSAASDVVVIQADYIKRADERARQQDERMADMERRLTTQLEVAEAARKAAETALLACNEERRAVAALYEQERQRNIELERERQELRSRIEALEAEVAKLRERDQ